MATFATLTKAAKGFFIEDDGPAITTAAAAAPVAAALPAAPLPGAPAGPQPEQRHLDHLAALLAGDGKDFGAWLMTIARNLTVDHFKSGRVRMESTTEDMSRHDDVTESTEDAVLANLTHEVLLDALHRLSDEQRDCLVMRFLQGLSIAETAAVLGRSDGAVKQLQLRGVRNLAKLLPEDLR